MGHLLFIMFLIDLWMKIRSVNDHLLQPREAIAYIPGCLKSNSKSILFRAHDKISAILQKWSFSFCIICVCHIYACMYVCMHLICNWSAQGGMHLTLDPFYSGDKKSDFHSVDLFMGKWSSPLLVKSQQYGCNGSERQSSFTQFPYVQRLCLVNSPIHISGHPMLLWSCLGLVIFWWSYYHPLMYLEC